jgi:hypothetical protein
LCLAHLDRCFTIRAQTNNRSQLTCIEGSYCNRESIYESQLSDIKLVD